MSTPDEYPFEIEGSDREPIRGEIRLPTGAGPRPLLVICHGFKGFKDWGFFPYLGRRLAERGIPNLIFNFSHSGIGADGKDFSRLDLFAKNTWARELSDLKSVMDAASEGKLPEPDRYDASSFHLLGHSRGGGVVILGAARDARVRQVAAIASISHVDRFSDEVKKKWREAGVIKIQNMRTNQEMPMDISFLEDIEGNRDAYSIRRATTALAVPLLLIHGEKDESVRPAEAEEIASWADPERLEMVILPDCNHVLNSKHPFPGPNPTLDHAIDILSDFLS
ncbi:MAG: prolyl oligopeptidase family serine peptidase [Planctomycetota bacterium]|nr:prolyl oligopeptidase family serine peptidase [Planctomycetota bacterium]